MYTIEKMLINEEDKIREKVLRKLENFIQNPEVQILSNGKRAFIKKAFQVLGKLFSIELGITYKLDLVNGEFFLSKEQHLITYHSRATEGGYYIYNVEDIAKHLYISENEIISLFEKLEVLAKMTPQEIEKSKAKFLKKAEKSAKKLVVQ